MEMDQLWLLLSGSVEPFAHDRCGGLPAGAQEVTVSKEGKGVNHSCSLRPSLCPAFCRTAPADALASFPPAVRRSAITLGKAGESRQ